eukprot:g30599.t1
MVAPEFGQCDFTFSLQSQQQLVGYKLMGSPYIPSSGKAKGGGLRFLINTSWCSDIVTLASPRSPDLEYQTIKCRPYSLPREITFTILIAVDILPHADVKNGLHKIYTATNTLEMEFPKALLIVTGDFNQLKKALSKYITTVMEFISKRVEGCVSKKSIPMIPNCKPWMNQEIHPLLKTRHAAFKSGDPGKYRESRYDLCKAITDAKGQYWTRLEAQTNHTDPHRQWHGLNNITGYKMEHSKIADNDTSLPDVLNAFYAQFEQNTTGVAMPAPTAPGTPFPSFTTADIRLVFLGANPRKAMGPDRDPSHALRSCANQLVKVFTVIFNLSLLQAEIPTCVKKTTITQYPRKHVQ